MDRINVQYHWQAQVVAEAAGLLLHPLKTTTPAKSSVANDRAKTRDNFHS